MGSNFPRATYTDVLPTETWLHAHSGVTSSRLTCKGRAQTFMSVHTAWLSRAKPEGNIFLTFQHYQLWEFKGGALLFLLS